MPAHPTGRRLLRLLAVVLRGREQMATRMLVSAGASGASQPRMTRALLLATVAAVPLIASGASTVKRLPPRMEMVLEVTSYGEQPRDLLALLVPFFAKNLYANPLKLRPDMAQEATAAFEHPSGDFVVTSGRFNCVVVAYYSLLPGKDASGLIARERAGRFQLALMDFLEGLPTPRPVPREVTFGSQHCHESS